MQFAKSECHFQGSIKNITMISMTKNDPISSTDRNQNTLQNFKMRVNENCVSFCACIGGTCVEESNDEAAVLDHLVT